METVKENLVVGLISDTHGLLRPEVAPFFKDCRAIIHAGDICDHMIVTELEKIAPVYPVRGNMDRGAGWPRDETIRLGGHLFHILHDLARLDLDPRAVGIEVVVFGHTHRPEVFYRDAVLYINPGSAGPRRGNLPVSLARLTFDQWRIIPEFTELS